MERSIRASGAGGDGDPLGEDRTADADRLSEDELFELLSNRRRRHILHALLGADRPLNVWDLARDIAAWEDGTDADAVTPQDRKRVYTALLQSHLPKLASAGVVEFDRDRGVVAATPAIDDLEIYMDVVRGSDLPWSDYYLGLAALSALLLGAVSLSVHPFGAVPDGVAVASIVGVFGVSALAHRYYARRSRLGIAEDPPSVELEYEERR